MSHRICRTCGSKFEASTMGTVRCRDCYSKPTLDEEITILTAKWYKYVNLDHHKDRDCHWYITKTYSYGDEAYYEAHHSGYILDHWTSPRCGTSEMAATLLRDKLRNEINGAIMHLKNICEDDEALEWLGHNPEHVKNLIEFLEQ
jgi:hypothetical protein